MKLNKKKAGFVVIIVVVLAIGLYFGGRSLFSSSDDVDTTEPKTNDNKTNDTNEFSSLSYYHQDNLEKYKTYKENNPNLSIEDIVTHVNMGIDVPFYSTDPIIVDNPDAIDVLINKVYKLPEDWAPSDLVVVDNNGQQMRKEAAEAYEDLKESCSDDGFELTAHSAYRSTEYQRQIYDNMVKTYGEDYTNKYSSRPGQSEHTTGLCVDISIDGIAYENIESSSHYDSFKERLEEYGFIVRYPEDKEDLTGYHYESWHIRYLGKDLAKKVNASGLTYDEYVARN
ncbi:MAG: D-alanyl-D-alanine carboxypeptidase family protein [Coprobacillaceae bacterium]